MGEDLKREILEHLKFLKEVIISSSPLALIGGGLLFLIYSAYIVKELPQSMIESSFFYFISAIFIYFIISFVSLLILPLYMYFENDGSINYRIYRYFENDGSNNDRFYKISRIIRIIFILFSILIYIFGNLGLFFVSYQNDFSIFSIFEISFWPALVLFIIIQLSMIRFLYSILRKNRDDAKALLFSTIFFITLEIFIYPRFFLIAPFYILKLGYFEANLTLDKEYVEKSGLKTYLEERCKIECLDESFNDNYCRIFKFFITCSEKCQTECLDELFKDTQNDNHCRVFKFFIFLGTSSEYIVGCSKNSDVRIHIPSDKVIAIEY